MTEWTTVTSIKQKKSRQENYVPPNLNRNTVKTKVKIDSQLLNDIDTVLKNVSKPNYIHKYLDDYYFDEHGSSILDLESFSLNKLDHRDLSRKYKNIINLFEYLQKNPYYKSNKYLQTKLSEYKFILKRIEEDLPKNEWNKELNSGKLYDIDNNKIEVIKNSLVIKHLDLNSSKIKTGKSFADLFK